jgi:hypothetical protein
MTSRLAVTPLSTLNLDQAARAADHSTLHPRQSAVELREGAAQPFASTPIAAVRLRREP